MFKEKVCFGPDSWKDGSEACEALGIHDNGPVGAGGAVLGPGLGWRPTCHFHRCSVVQCGFCLSPLLRA